MLVPADIVAPAATTRVREVEPPLTKDQQLEILRSKYNDRRRRNRPTGPWSKRKRDRLRAEVRCINGPLELLRPNQHGKPVAGGRCQLCSDQHKTSRDAWKKKPRAVELAA